MLDAGHFPTIGHKKFYSRPPADVWHRPARGIRSTEPFATCSGRFLQMLFSIGKVVFLRMGRSTRCLVPYEDARVSRRVLEPTPYGDDGVEEFVLPQLIGRTLLMRPGTQRPKQDKTYYTAKDFWRDVLDERLVVERIVRLEAMNLFEWFPRNPGLFHTARRSRRSRENRILTNVTA